jgi:hypothetical protein
MEATASTKPATAEDAREFKIDVPEEQIEDLRRRLEATRLPHEELVEDHSQGVQLNTMQELTRYWATERDWRRCEAELNALPHPLLADEHRDLLGTSLLGEPSRLLRRQGRRDPGSSDRFHGRALSSSTELGGEGVSQAHPLQRGGRRRTLRRLGAAADLFGRDSCDLRVTAMTATTRAAARRRDSANALVGDG